MKTLTFLLIIIGFLVYSFLNLGIFLDVTKEPQKTELLVCLGGGYHEKRVQKTINLYKNGFLTRKNIIFTGVPALDRYVYKEFDSSTTIILKPEVRNTMEEVLAIKDFVKENQISSVTFITEAPHSKRIEMFWENFGDKLSNVNFSVVASELRDWDKVNYFENKSSREYALGESAKLIYNFFLYGVLQKFGFKEDFEELYQQQIDESKRELIKNLKDL